jgi:hypothetical protein
VATQQPLTRLVFDFLRRFVFVFNIITTITIVVIVVNMIVGDSIITGIGIIIAAIGIIIVGGVGIVAIDGGGNRCAMPGTKGIVFCRYDRGTAFCFVLLKKENQ